MECFSPQYVFSSSQYVFFFFSIFPFYVLIVSFNQKFFFPIGFFQMVPFFRKVFFFFFTVCQRFSAKQKSNRFIFHSFFLFSNFFLIGSKKMFFLSIFPICFSLSTTFFFWIFLFNNFFEWFFFS